jgi:hypothetical protein
MPPYAMTRRPTPASKSFELKLSSPTFDVGSNLAAGAVVAGDQQLDEADDDEAGDSGEAPRVAQSRGCRSLKPAVDDQAQDEDGEQHPHPHRRGRTDLPE